MEWGFLGPRLCPLGRRSFDLEYWGPSESHHLRSAQPVGCAHLPGLLVLVLSASAIHACKSTEAYITRLPSFLYRGLLPLTLRSSKVRGDGRSISAASTFVSNIDLER